MSPLGTTSGDEPGGLFGGEDTTPRRRWLALIAASALLQFSYWPLVYAIGAAQAGDESSGAAAALGLALAPATFVLLAFLSRHRRAPGAVLKAMGLFVLVGMPLVLVPTLPLVGVYAAYAAGGILCLRPLSIARPYRPRVLAAAAGAVYLYLLILIDAHEFAQMSAAAFPLAISGIADEFVLGRAAARRDDDRP